jgi:hypothetical protein
MAGSGTISVAGGNGGNTTNNSGGGGSGGRVSLSSSNKFSGTISVVGGAHYHPYAGPGDAGSYHQAITNYCDTGSFASSCTISKKTYLREGETWNVAGTLALTGTGSIVSPNSTYETSIVAAGDISLATGASISASFKLVKATNFTLQSGAVVTGDIKSLWTTANANLNGTMTGNIAVTVEADASVPAGAYISADASGFAGGGYQASGAGPGLGVGTPASNRGGGGGGHGGAGGNGYNFAASGGAAYNAVMTNTPLMKGSGGGGGYGTYGGAGGGVLQFNVGGTLTVNGTISANGQNGFNYSGNYGGGGGAGGSIWIRANTLTGAGIIRANAGAGAGTSAGGGGGGGGRVTSAIFSADSYTGVKTANGGAAGTNGVAGSAGVVTWPAAPASTSARHVVFGTSTTYDGNLGDIAGADAKCQTRGEAAGHFGRWAAVISSSTSDVYDRLILLGRLHNMNDEFVASTLNDLFDGSVTNAVKYTESVGTIAGEVRAWTGSSFAGSGSANTCADWSSFAAGTGMMGNATSSSSTWVESGDVTCGTALRLYCVSQ